MTRRRAATSSLVGQAILAGLQNRGWTQSDLAIITGVSGTFISHLIGGHRRIGPAMALRLEAAFETPVKWWLDMQRQTDAIDLAREVGCLQQGMEEELRAIVGRRQILNGEEGEVRRRLGRPEKGR